MLRPSDDLLHALPKAELHCHLDGSLRPETMVELARRCGVGLPETDPERLRAYMRVDDARSLEDYLDRFAVTLALMQDAKGIERIAYELAEDNARENVRYLEVRFSPALNTRKGLDRDEVLEAALRGLARAEQDYPIRTGVIVCGLRNLPPSTSTELAELAVAFRDRGVVAFDLAGAENGHPAGEHAEAYRIALDAGLHATVHAGEAYGPPSIREAIEACGAQRLGHGTRLFEDPELEEEVRAAGIPLEICLTSNVQTRAVSGVDQHGLRRYYDAGIRVTLCTDNRLMSGTSVTDEYVLARDHLGFRWTDLKTVARMGFEAAFVNGDVKADMLERFDAEVDGLEESVR